MQRIPTSAKLTLLLLIAALPLNVSPMIARPSAQPLSAEADAASSYSAQGVLDIVYGDSFNHGGATSYYLSLINGTHIPLSFSGMPPHFSYFARKVVVHGYLRTEFARARAVRTMVVSNITLSTGQSPANVPPHSSFYFPSTVSGTKRIIMLLLRYSDDTSVPHVPSYYSGLINPSTGNSVNSFYLTQSWGILSIQADVTPSWMILPHPKSYYAPCDFSTICANVDTLFNDGTALGSANGVNFANYDMISLVLSNDLDCCAWGGSETTTLSGVYKTWGTTWLPPWATEVGIYSHETGHSIGLPHSGWVYFDYDSPWDVMSEGDRYNSASCGSYSSDNAGGTRTIICYWPADTMAAYKDALGWIDSNHMLTVPPGGTAVASIDSLAAPLSSPLKMIKICISGYSCTTGGSASHYLTIEVRTHYGFDQYLPGEGVIISMYQGDRPTITGSCFFITDNPPVFPVDSTPGDFSTSTCSGTGLNNAQWTVGQTYANSPLLGQNQIKILSQSGTGPVTFNVQISPPIASITITSNPTGSGFVTVNSAATATPQTFNWVTGSTQTLAANSPVDGTTGVRFLWTSWSDGGAQAHTITVPISSTTYTANFKTQYQLTVAVSPSAGGTTSPTVGSYWYDSSTSVSVSASAAGGYSFYSWSLDGTNVGSSPSYSVLMDSPHVLTANFRGISSISLAVSSASITLGQSVTLSGAITPSQAAGTMVMLTYSSDAGSTWSVFITTQTDGTGGYSITWLPPYPGTYQLKASWSGNTNYLGATSPTRYLTVTGTLPSQITVLVAGPNSASRGAQATFDVLVTNPGTSVRTTLYLEVTGPGGYEYFDTLTVTLPASGSARYQFTWQIPTPISPGNYQIVVGTIPPTPTTISQTQVSIT